MTSTYGMGGIVLDGYAEIKTSMQTAAKSEFGESVDLEEDSFFGHIIEVISLEQARTNEVVQFISDGRSVENASGTALDGLVGVVGQERSSDSYSTITDGVSITATKATTIPAGTTFKTSTGITFATDTALVFTAAGADTVSATCTVVGANQVAIGELTTIGSSVTGMSAVTNTVAAVPGSKRQTDAELKSAHSAALETSGEDDSAGIYEALEEISTVTASKVIDNDTSATVDGIPAHYIRVIVIGGTDAEIGDAIWNNKTQTVGTFGAESVVAYNSTTGQTKTINFTRGSYESIYIKINITKQPAFPTDGETTIKEAFATIFAGKRLGDDVVYNELLGAVYSVAGVQLNSLYSGIVNPPTGVVDITMDNTEYPTLDITRDTTTNLITAINVEIVTA